MAGAPTSASRMARLAGLLTRRSTLLAALVLGLFLAAGFWMYRSYGIAWDETTQVEMGLKNYLYVMRSDPALLAWRDRYYGPFFELLLVIFQSRGSSQAIYYSRHMLTFLFFWAGLVGFYALALRLFRKTSLALLASTLLMLSPRMLGDAFTNTKDIPFLVLYIFSLYTLFLWLDRPAWYTASLHALFSAALLATRLPGLVIPAFTLGALGWQLLNRRWGLRQALIFGLVYLPATAALMVLFWPALWPNPPAELLTAFQMMSRFPHETEMLYLGQVINSLQVPWHYIPVWMAVTTPLPYLILFVMGVPATLREVWQQSKQPAWFASTQLRDAGLLLAAFFVPLLAIMALRPTLYDGWRHMYFIYPPFLLFATRGAQACYEQLARWRMPVRTASSALLAISLLPILYWMAVNHPYQSLYFNRLAGPDMRTAQQRFQLDYWGLGYRQGLEYLLVNDPSSAIFITAETEPGRRNAAIFPTEQEKRLQFTGDLSQATYFINNYYRDPQGYQFEHEIYSVWVGNAPILSIYRLSEEDKQ